MPYVLELPDIPDYALVETLVVSTNAQLKAIADPTRSTIAALLLERSATTSELAVALGRPKGTIDHHLKVLAGAGLVHVVRTRKVRAMTERFWGRTARTFKFEIEDPALPTTLWFLRDAYDEIERSLVAHPAEDFSTTLRHARIPAERAREFAARLQDLALEFVAAERGGDTMFGLLVAVYPTDQPILPEAAQS